MLCVHYCCCGILWCNPSVVAQANSHEGCTEESPRDPLTQEVRILGHWPGVLCLGVLPCITGMSRMAQPGALQEHVEGWLTEPRLDTCCCFAWRRLERFMEHKLRHTPMLQLAQAGALHGARGGVADGAQDAEAVSLGQTPNPKTLNPNWFTWRRLERFMEHVEGWLTEPKMTAEVKDAWLDIWDRCDKDFGAKLRSKVGSAPVGKQVLVGASKA